MTQEKVLEPWEVVKHLESGDKVRRETWRNGEWIRVTPDGCVVDETGDEFHVNLDEIWERQWVLYVEPIECIVTWLKVGDKLSQYDVDYVVAYVDEDVAFCKSSDFGLAPYWTITKAYWPHSSKDWKVEAG
jgi:hypothetical protein